LDAAKSDGSIRSEDHFEAVLPALAEARPPGGAVLARFVQRGQILPGALAAG